MSKVVIGLSGGMDSATVAGFYHDRGDQVVPVSFDYGSKHNAYEGAAAKAIAKYYGLGEIIKVDLPFIGDLFSSNLLKKGGAIPEGHYEDANMSLTVVPGRNVIFISILMGLAWSIGADIVAVGTHAGDHVVYADCRAGFIAAMNAAVIQGSGDRVRLESPFQYLDKAGILKAGYSFQKPAPYHLSRTCYCDQELSCGRCGSCRERLESFEMIGRKDPISYE